MRSSWLSRWADTTFDQAEVYDRVLVPAVFGPCAEHVAASAVSGSEATVLDAGCGTGALTRAAARRLRPDSMLAAVDTNAAMLDSARRHPQSEGPTVEFGTGDIQELPFPDDMFDLVLCQHVLQYVTDPGIAVQEFARVTHPCR